MSSFYWEEYNLLKCCPLDLCLPQRAFLANVGMNFNVIKRDSNTQQENKPWGIDFKTMQFWIV